jgi:hypothetical protein
LPRLVIGMTTCRRPPGHVYAATTVMSLMAAGFHDVPLTFFAEPEHDLDEYLPIHLRHRDLWSFEVAPGLLGAFQNWRRALTTLVDCVDDDGWVLIVQDDVVFRRDCRARLDEGMDLHPDAGFLSPYASVAMVGTAHKARQSQDDDAWIPPSFHNNAFWGALTLCLPRSSAAKLLTLRRFRDHDHHRKIDVVVGNCMRDMRLPMWIHRPSLCEHIGAYSTLGRHRIRGIAWGRQGYRFRPDDMGA